MKKPPFEPGKEIFRWGPTPGRYFYMSDFGIPAVYGFREKYHIPGWCPSLVLFKEAKMIFLNANQEVIREGKRIFNELILPIRSRKSIRRNYESHVNELIGFHSQIDQTDMDHITDEELLQQWKKFTKIIYSFWISCIPPELGNYGSPHLLKKKLTEYIPSKELGTAMEILTAPEKLSFYQKEEIELAETNDLHTHAKKYFWLKNSYAGIEILTADFFQKHKKELEPNLKKNILQRIQEVKDKKKEIIEKYHLPKEIVEISHALCEAMEWQDDRKKYIWIFQHYKDLFRKQVAKRFSYEPEGLLDLAWEELAEIMQGKDLHPKISERENGFGVYWSNTVKEINSVEAQKYWKLYASEKVMGEVKAFSGIVASKGTGSPIKGIVKILLDPRKSETFPPGAVLVTTMTTPEYVFVMKKAAAILTDTGGLTSHAAIVSRELKKPCIVGTKVATQVLRDGDLVEIDTHAGTIKVMKK